MLNDGGEAKEEMTNFAAAPHLSAAPVLLQSRGPRVRATAELLATLDAEKLRVEYLLHLRRPKPAPDVQHLCAFFWVPHICCRGHRNSP